MRKAAQRLVNIMDQTVSGRPDDWDTAVAALRRASRSPWPPSAYRAQWALAVTLLGRGDALGRPADLREGHRLLTKVLAAIERGGSLGDVAEVQLWLAEANARLLKLWLDQTMPGYSAIAVRAGDYLDEAAAEDGWLDLCPLPGTVAADFDSQYREVVASYERALATARKASRTGLERFLTTLAEVHGMAAHMTGRVSVYDIAVSTYRAALAECQTDDIHAQVGIRCSLTSILVTRAERRRRSGDLAGWRADCNWAGECLDAVFGAELDDQTLIHAGPAALLSAHHWLGHALDRGQWADAANRGRLALAFSRRLHDKLSLWSEQESVRAVTAGMHDRVAYAVVRADPDSDAAAREALLMAEEGRAALLGEILGHVSDDDLADRLLADNDCPNVALELRELVMESRRLHRQAREDRKFGAELTSHQLTVAGDPRTMLSSAILANRLARNRARREAQRTLGAGSMRDGAEVALSAASPGHPVVYLISLAEDRGLSINSGLGGLALVVTADNCEGRSVRAVMLPGLRAEDAFVRAARWSDGRLASAGEGRARSRQQVDELLGWLGEHVMEPVVRRVGQPERLTLIPGGMLGYLPLHAAVIRLNGERRHLLEMTVVSYAPSAQILLACQHRAARHFGACAGLLPSRLVAVVDPYLGPGRAESQLRWARPEVSAVKSALGSANSVLAGPAATVPAFLAALVHAHQAGEPAVVHLACHATTDALVALDSHLLLASTDPLAPGGVELQLAELLDQPLTACRLVALSACQSAVSAREAPNESLSLAAGLLAGGASAVIATQCPVTDFASAVLVARFYFEWSANPGSPSSALAVTQRWLANEPVAVIDLWLRREHRELHASIMREPADYVRHLRNPLSWAPFTLHGS